MRIGSRRCRRRRRRHGGRVFTDQLVHGGRSMGGDMRRGGGSIKRLHFGSVGHFVVPFSLFFCLFILLIVEELLDVSSLCAWGWSGCGGIGELRRKNNHSNNNNSRDQHGPRSRERSVRIELDELEVVLSGWCRSRVR